MKQPWIYLIISATLFASCAGKKDDQDARSLYAASMKIHDEIMPRMDEIYQLQDKLKAQRDVLLQDSTGKASQLQALNAALSALNQADRSMMNWMHHIQDIPGDHTTTHPAHHTTHDSPDSIPEADILLIQQKQKAEIEKIKEAFESSISAGNKLLNTLHQ